MSYDPEDAPDVFMPVQGSSMAVGGLALRVALSPNPIGLLQEIQSPASRAITPDPPEEKA